MHFYGLPKIHKSSQVCNTCQANNREIINIPNVNYFKLPLLIDQRSCQTHMLSDRLGVILKTYY